MMKFLGIFRFEFLYQVRSLATWLFFAVEVILIHQMVLGNFLPDALYDDFYVNSPFVIAVCTVFGSLIAILSSAAIAGEAAARDSHTRMYPLVYSTSVNKVEYLGGKFLAALVLNVVVLLGVPIGIMLAVYLPYPGIDSGLVGPFRPAAYLTAFFYIALPNAFAATSIQFMVSSLNRRIMTSYVGSIFIFFMTYIIPIITVVLTGAMIVASYIDAVGVLNVVTLISNWTPGEKSTRLITIEGIFLTNRVIWFCVAITALAITYLNFKFVHHIPLTLWETAMKLLRLRRSTAQPVIIEDTYDVGQRTIELPDLPRTFRFRGYVRQSLTVTWDSFWMIVRYRGGWFVLGFSTFLMSTVIPINMSEADVPELPRTEHILTFLTAPVGHLFSHLIVIPLFLVVYAGELMWRERDAGVSEITDTSPVPEWTLLTGKYLGLALFVAVWMLLFNVAGLVMQLFLGYLHPEIGLQMKVLFGLQLPEYLLFIALVLAIHTLVNQKYIGHLLSFFALAFIGFASFIGIEHNLLVYSTSPAWYYSDMRGFGASIGPWVWFKIYWAGWALLLAVVARVFWVRGKDHTLKARVKVARLRFTPSTIAVGVVACLVIFFIGGFIFFNTNLLNDYVTVDESMERQAEYERRYSKYRHTPQPATKAVNLKIELYPTKSAMDIQGTYRLVNNTQAPIDSIHLAVAGGVETRAIKFSRSFNLLINDEDHRYLIYGLQDALQPGDSIELSFEVILQPHGFRNNGIRRAVVANGTYFTQGDENWLPYIGYQWSFELLKPGERRKYKLPQRPLVPSLYDKKAPYDIAGREQVAFEAVIGTDDNQVAVAPGELKETWTEKKRRYFRYSTSAPISNSYSFFSANYEVREVHSNGVNIRLYHHPSHTENLDRVMRGAQATLAYHIKNFGPYPHNHLTIIERGGTSKELSSEPTAIDYSEAYSRFAPEDDGKDLDLPFAVMAHEIGHQWWGAQLQYAIVEGGGLLSESLAWYTAMGVVENTYGHDHLQRLRKFFRQPSPIPPIRSSVPLIRAMDPYANYRKGPFALYAMTQYIGRDSVNHAIRNLLGAHPPGKAPLATTLDLYRELQAVTPDTLQYLLHDLFAANTFWDLETEGVTARKLDGDRWEVTLDVVAHKATVDSTGVETDVPMNDWINVGVFGEDGKGGEERGEPSKGRALYLRNHRIRSGEQKITITVPSKPARAGIDTDYLLIDLEPHNNTHLVTIEK